jgi:hypothetical protein
MKTIQDALYNWLTIKVVCDERPEDMAAKETEEMFREMLEEDHQVKDIVVTQNDLLYFVSYLKEGRENKTQFPKELIDVMINQINDSPERFRNYPL